MKHNTRAPKFDHSLIDWSKKDAALAREFGVTRERMRQLRKKQLLPSSVTIKPDYPIDPSLTAEQNAAINGISKTHMQYIARQRKVMMRNPLASYNWGAVDWTMKNAAISSATGIPVQNVAVKRCKMKKRGFLP